MPRKPDDIDDALLEDALYDELDVPDDDDDDDRETEDPSERELTTIELADLLASSESKIEREIRALRTSASELASERTYEETRWMLRKQVRSLYDAQRLRIQTASRINRTAGTETQLTEIDKQIMVLRAKQLLRWEKGLEVDLRVMLEGTDVYNKILARRPDYWGVGPRMAGVMISEFDIRRQDTCSKMWSFAGLAPEPSWQCKVCRTQIPCLVADSWKKQLTLHHQARIAVLRTEMLDRLIANGATKPKARAEVEKAFANRTAPVYKAPPADLLIPKKHPRTKCELAGKPMTIDMCVEGKKAARPVAGYLCHYNQGLRTKLLGVLAPILIKGAAKSPIRLKYYDGYKSRKESAGWGQSKGHRHSAAMRYMIKMMLADFHREWRILEGLPVRPMYQEEYLGHVSSRA